MACVRAHGVEEQYAGFVGSQRLCQVLEEGEQGRFPRACTRLPEDVPAGIVDRADHGELVILTCRRNPQCLPFAPPDRCQLRVGVDFALVPRVHVDQRQSLSSGSFGLSSWFFSRAVKWA
jgi:hypothetical protein